MEAGGLGLVVRQLSFEGNRFIDDYTIVTSIATSPSSLVARWWLTRWMGVGEKRYLSEDEFRRDVLRVQLLYHIAGFPQVHVDTVVRRRDGGAWIRFLISEGRPIRVRSIGITGVGSAVPQAELRHDLPLAVGEPFSRSRFQAAGDTIRSVLRERGHPFVEVFRSYEVNEDSLVADVAFEVLPGPRAVVDRVVVEGTQNVDAVAVRRMLAFAPGSVFRQSALYSSQRDLYRLGAFSYVNITLLDSVPEPADTGIGVRVQVAEGQLRRLRAGAGYGTVDCFRVLTGWTVNNVFGGGRSLDMSARASKIGAGDPLGAGFEHNLCDALSEDAGTERLKLNYNVTATLREPYLWSRRMRGALSLAAERHSEVQTFVRQVVGGNVSVTRETRWDIPVTVSYALSYGRTLAEPATFCAFLNVCRISDTELFLRNRLQSMISAGLVRDRSNSLLDPTRGSTFTAEFRHASRTIGSDSLIQFTKGVLDLASYHPLGRRTTFAWRVRAGTILSPRVTVADSVRFVPPGERFYAGGPTSVRGFPQNGLGPLVRVVDRSGADSVTLTSPTGGEQLFIANAELRFPLPVIAGRPFNGALFVDAGQVFERGRGRQVDLSGVRVTPGFGIRVPTPLGPMRFDIAYNPHDPEAGPLYERRVNELVLIDPTFAPSPPTSFFGRLRFHFAVGQAF